MVSKDILRWIKTFSCQSNYIHLNSNMNVRLKTIKFCDICVYAWSLLDNMEKVKGNKI